jgi:phage repressor protein C with HTH and peptisase S24 domain
MNTENLSEVFFYRLKEAIAPEKLRPWCERNSIPHSTITGAAHRNAVPGAATLVDVAQRTGRSIDWLLGIGENDAPKAATLRLPVNNEWEEFVQIPIYDVQASAGHGSFVSGQERVSKYLAFRRDFLDKELRISTNGLYCVRVRGVSMEPLLRNGNPVLIDPNDKEVFTEGPHFLRLEGALLLKNLQKLPGGRLRIWSENQSTNAFAPIEVEWPVPDNVDLQIFGRVRWSDTLF